VRIIGSDKISFISMMKHGSSTLETLVRDYDFIDTNDVGVKEESQNERILLFPWRDEFEALISGFFEDLLNDQIYTDISLNKLRNLFNKQNNSNVLNVPMGHKRLLVHEEFFQWFLTDYDKFYFFDLKYLSNPKLIEWISEHDSRWKNVSIPQKSQKSKMRDKVEQLKNMLSQIKDELGDDYLDYDNIQDWTTFIYYYEFSKMFFESRKKSEQFLNFD